MNQIIATVLERKRTVIALLIFLILWGSLSYVEVSKESVPDVKIPIIFTVLRNEGMSPDDSERLMVKPVEVEVRGIEGVKEMRSSAYENGGNVVLEFAAGFNSNKALLDVREAVDRAKSELPEDADEPKVEEVNLSLFPVLVIKLSGQVPLRTLYRLADDLSDRIESKVSTVLKAEVVGDREEAVEIVVDPTTIDSYSIAFDQAISSFTGNNQLISAGKLDVGKGRFSIKVPGLIENVRDIMELPIITNGDAVVRFKDIAQIRRTFKDAENYARDRGVTAVAIEVSKRSGTNIIDTVEAVKRVVANESKDWQGNVNIAYAQDDSSRIKTRLTDLQNNLISAILLVMLVIVLSLGLRSALLVGIAVPGSFLTGVAIITIMGYTMNIVVLFALIFAIGMLVDAAIIVVEFADRKLSEGHSTFEAFLEAAQRMAWPVITSIGTILVVFLPLLFWPGVVGQFMKYMPITLIAVLSASICMALFFLPAIGSVFLKPKTNASDNLLATSDEGNLSKISGITKLYITLLKGIIRTPKTVLLLIVGVLVSLQWSYKQFGKGIEFFPDIEPDIANIYVHARDNMALDEKDVVMKQVEQRITDMDELASIYTRTGDPPRGGQPLPDDIIGSVSLELADWQKRRKADEIFKDLRKRLSDLAGVIIEVEKLKPGPPTRKPIDMIIRSRKIALLEPTVIKLRNFLDQLEGLKGIEDDRPVPGIDWNLAIDRAQAAKFDVNVSLVGNAIRLVTNGVKIGTYRPDNARDELDILVRYGLKDRNLQQLDQVRVATINGSVPISNFVKRTAKPKLGTINRQDGYRVLSIKADVKKDVLVNDKVKEIKAFIGQANFASEVEIVFKGEEEDRDEAQTFLIKAFGISIFLIAIILLTQFNSFFSVGVVLSAIVMSTMGVYIGLLIHDLAFGVVMGGIGVIALAGIIVSNNIILIETYDRLAATLTNPSVIQMRDIILKTCAQRARPVILTQLTTVLGLMPIMFGITVDFLNLEITIGAPSTQWWVLLSTCIVYGATFASIMTLIATPCMLMARVRYRSWRKKPLV